MGNFKGEGLSTQETSRLERFHCCQLKGGNRSHGTTQGASANLGEYIKEQSEPTEETGVAREVSGHVPQIPWTPMFQDKGHIPDRRVLECAAEFLGKIADSIVFQTLRIFPSKTVIQAPPSPPPEANAIVTFSGLFDPFIYVFKVLI